MACVLIKKAEYSVQVIERSDQALVFQALVKKHHQQSGIHISA